MLAVKNKIGIVTKIDATSNENRCCAFVAEIDDGKVVETENRKAVSDMCYTLQPGYFVVINEDGSIKEVLTIIDMPLVIKEMNMFKNYYNEKLLESRGTGNLYDSANYYGILENINHSLKLYNSYISEPAPVVNHIK